MEEDNGTGHEDVDDLYPLRRVLPEELKDIDPKSIFHDFKKDQPLRFGRMMQPLMKESSKLEIWWQYKSFYKRPKPLETEEQTEEEVTKEITEDDVVLDDLYLLRMQTDSTGQIKKAHDGSDEEDDVTPWRNGPSKIWFDNLNLPNNATSSDLLERLKRNVPQEPPLKGAKEVREHEKKIIESLNNSTTRKWSNYMNYKAFLPVNLMNWEENIVYDEVQGRKVFMKKYGKGRMPECGWIPTSRTKSYESFVNFIKSNSIETLLLNNPNVEVTFDSQNERNLLNEKVSMFPFDNYEFKNTRWEDDIIYDPLNLEKMPEPKVLVIDFKDDPKAYGIPQDCPPETVPDEAGANTTSENPFSPPKADKNGPAPTRKSKMILSQVQQRQKQEEEEQMENTMARFNDKDAFNLSCDDYYCTSNKKGKLHNTDIVIQHSVPAQNISTLFFPTHLTPDKLRIFHRVPLEALNKRFLRTLYHGRSIPIKGLSKYIKRMEQERHDIKQAEGGGDYFFMREPKDLSGKDGTLCLFEYMEEHPPLLSQPGMSSVIKNYHRRKPGVDAEPKLEFGSLAYTHSSPFLGNIPPGSTIQSIENNMYSAPIFQHRGKTTDYLLIKTKEGFFLRKHPALFVVGQEHPRFEVPSPNSKAATNFSKDFIMAFIYRLFTNSTENPKRIKIEDIRHAFPNQAEPSIRKRLKLCSDFKRFDKGNESNYWVLRDDFRLPSIEEIKAMVTPEMCCAQYSMMTEERRLQDAGYRVKNNVIQEKENDSEDEVALEDEQKSASWNTTRAFINAKSGRCVLDNTGIADPTGKGLGFSFVRVSSKPPKEAKKDETPGPKKLVTGTNADLRKLPLKEAKEICRGYGLTDEDLSKLTRWEIIDVIRSLSTQSAGKNSENGGLSRFARGNVKFNFTDMQEKFKKHCQEIWDKQVEMLSNSEELLTDDGESGEESENEDEKKMQEKLDNKELTEKEKRQLEYEREERERKEFKNALENGGDSLLESSNSKLDKKKKKNEDDEWENKKLIINRVVKFADRPDERRSETVTDPEVIKYYVKIKQNKDAAYIKAFAEADDDYKEEKRREKRRLKDKLRRIQTKGKNLKDTVDGKPNEKKDAKPPVIKESLLKMKCSACGALGHMKTNKLCNLYGQRETKIGDLCKTIDDSFNDDDSRLSANGSVVLDGFKMKIPKTIVQKKKSKVLKLAIPRSVLPKNKGDESIHSHFGMNEDANDSPAYFTDMSMEQTIQDSDAEHLTDVDNYDSSTYHQQPVKRGPGRPPLPSTLAKRKAMEGCEYLAKPVKNVQRRRADPKVSMATIFTEVMNEIKNVPGYVFFNKPVSEKIVKDYYTIIKNPIDLQTIKKKIDNHEYELRKTFIEDLKLLVDNSMLYNGATSEYTKTAIKIFDVAKEKISSNDDRLIELEKQINPLLDDNDIVGFSYILGQTVQHCKLVPKSTAFHVEVDRHKNPSYYCYIMKPMHLGLLESNIEKRMYSSVDEFLADVRLIYENSKTFNSENHDLTKKAAEIVRKAVKYLRGRESDLRELEANMVQQKLKEEKDAKMSKFFFEDQPEEIEYEEVEEPEPEQEAASPREEDPLFLDLALSDTDEEGDDFDGVEAKKPRFDDTAS